MTGGWVCDCEVPEYVGKNPSGGDSCRCGGVIVPPKPPTKLKPDEPVTDIRHPRIGPRCVHGISLSEECRKCPGGPRKVRAMPATGGRP